jgi:hypothetical protein
MATLPPTPLDLKAVNAVTADVREVLDEYFEWVLVDEDGKPITDAGSATSPVTTGTGCSPRVRGQGALAEALDPPRVEQLAAWWRRRIKELRKELSPALAEVQAKSELCAVLAEEVQESTLDTEANRVVRAAVPKKSATKKK